MTLTIRLTKLRFAVGIAGSALIGAASAVAAGTFTDVPTDAFYHDASEWAKTNDITTGSPAGSDTFKPEDPVKRGESVVFLNRYDTNIVQPALAALQADTTADTLDGLHANDLVRAAQVSDSTGVNEWNGSTLDHDLTLTAPVAGALLVTSTTTVGRALGETATGPGEVYGTLRIDGADVTDFIGTSKPIDFDLTGFTTEDGSVVMHHLIPVSAGSHTITSRVAASVPAGGLVKVYGRTLTALFVPFDGTGATFGG